QSTSLPEITNEQSRRILNITKNGKGAILVGPQVLENSEPNLALRALVRIAGEDGALFPLFPLGNEAGVIKAGMRPEMLPGPSSVTVEEARSHAEKIWGGGSTSDGLHLIEMREKAQKGNLDVLYVAEGSISVKGFEKVPTIIYQSPYPSEWIDFASVILPSATFVEEEGTFVNLEMMPLRMKAIAKPPGEARQDWHIIAEIGKKLGAQGFNYKSIDEVWEELSRFTRKIEVGGQAQRDSWKPATKEMHVWYPRYRGAIIPERIEDLAIFIDALPERDESRSEETLDDLVKRVKRKHASKAVEVSR
ncbi:MAG: molybdopterin-dependent oxidoreductase, partial [Candidatus Hodarchaeota archaeon]